MGRKVEKLKAEMKRSEVRGQRSEVRGQWGKRKRKRNVGF
jgi:hypothetical protein